MRAVPLHLDAGRDLRRSLETLAAREGAGGFVLGVVGNLSRARFQCPGRPAPTQLEGELEIISLSGTLAPERVHLHLSVSDGEGRVWGGHLEPGSLVLRAADLLVGLLPAAAAAAGSPRVEVAVLPGCPFSARAVRMLRTLGIPHRLQTVESPSQRSEIERRSGRSSLPQVFLDGEAIGGYDALADRHGRGELEVFRAP
jgi:predicted DNA-binding protein with PD1-like motif/glutaredoxin